MTEKKLRKPIKIAAILFVAAGVFALTAIKAYAVFISPVTIVIKDKQLATRITVNNRSAVPRKVKLSWERRTQTADGKMVKLEEGQTMPGYRPADPYIRFSPREFTLQPYSYQKIRLIVMRNKDMEPGEYRSHLLLEERPVPHDKDGTDSQKMAAAEPTKQSFGGEITLQVNKSTPVYVLHGETDVKLALDNVTLTTLEGKKALKVHVANSSTRTIYARIDAQCTKSDGSTQVENIMVMRIYPEAKTTEREKALTELDPAQCSSMTVTATGYKDFQYDGKELSRITL